MTSFFQAFNILQHRYTKSKGYGKSRMRNHIPHGSFKGALLGHQNACFFTPRLKKIIMNTSPKKKPSWICWFLGPLCGFCRKFLSKSTPQARLDPQIARTVSSESVWPSDRVKNPLKIAGRLWIFMPKFPSFRWHDQLWNLPTFPFWWFNRIPPNLNGWTGEHPGFWTAPQQHVQRSQPLLALGFRGWAAIPWGDGNRTHYPPLINRIVAMENHPSIHIYTYLYIYIYNYI